MGADSVLVNAAFKEAVSRAGADVPNMKPLIDSAGAINKSVFGVVNTAMNQYAAKKAVGRAGVRKQLDGFQKQVNAGVKDMYAQDEPMPDLIINAFRDKILALQDEFELYNTYGKGDTQENAMARSRIDGELKRVIGQANQFRGKTDIFFENLKDVDPGNVNGENVNAYRQGLDFQNYSALGADGKVSAVYGKNGIEITSRNYDTQVSGGFGALTPSADGSLARTEKSVGKDVVITLASLNENFRPTDLEHHVGIMTDVGDLMKDGMFQGEQAKTAFNANGEMIDFKWDEDAAVSTFTRQVDSRENFRNVVNSRVKGLYEVKTSFKDSLEKNINISVDLLQNMFVDEDGGGVNDLELVFKQLDIAGGKDGGGDGVIDDKDLAASGSIPGFERNLDAMIDALTNTDNPAFDMETSAPMLGAFLAKAAEGRSKLAFGKTAGERSNDKGGNGKGATGSQIIYGNANLGSKSFVVQDDILDRATRGESIVSWGNDRFDPDPNKPGNYIQEGTTTSVPIDQLLRGKHFGMNERMNSRKLKYNTGLPDVNEVEAKEAAVVATPNSEAFKWNLGRSGRIEVVDNWRKEFPDFKFDNPGTMRQTVTITAPNGETLEIKLGSGGGDKVKEAKAFNEFMEKNKI